MLCPIKHPVNCKGWVETASERHLSDTFIPIAGFSGTIDNLQGADNFKPTTEDMPIDMIINPIEDDDDNNEWILGQNNPKTRRQLKWGVTRQQPTTKL